MTTRHSAPSGECEARNELLTRGNNEACEEGAFLIPQPRATVTLAGVKRGSAETVNEAKYRG